MKLRRIAFALAAACLVGAGPAAGQQAAAGSWMQPGSQPDAALFPRVCILCDGTRALEGVPGQSGAGSEGSVSAPLLGAAIGFVAGILAYVFFCNGDRTCEMGQILFPLLGAMAGWTVGKTIEDGPPSMPPH